MGKSESKFENKEENDIGFKQTITYIQNNSTILYVLIVLVTIILGILIFIGLKKAIAKWTDDAVKRQMLGRWRMRYSTRGRSAEGDPESRI